MGHKRNEKKKRPEPTGDHQQPPSHQPVEARVVKTVRIDPSPQNEERDAEQARFWKRQLNLARWLNWITAGGIFVGLLGLVFIYLGLRATKQSADAATRSAKTAYDALVISESPYIYQVTAKPRPFIVGKPPVVDATFVNSGKLPAVNWAIGPIVEVRSDEPKVFNSGEVGSRGEFPPNIPRPYVFSGKTNLTGAEIEGLANGSLRVFWYGFMEYDSPWVPGSVLLSVYCNMSDPSREDGEMIACPQPPSIIYRGALIERPSTSQPIPPH